MPLAPRPLPRPLALLVLAGACATAPTPPPQPAVQAPAPAAGATVTVWYGTDRARTEAGVTTLHVVAHSMGNRLVAGALEQMALEGTAPPLGQLVMAAPDVGVADFRARFQARLPQMAERVTVYASSRDRALAASERIHRMVRVGDPDGGILGTPGIDTVDASTLDTDMLGHAYFGTARSVLADLHCLLRFGTPPEQRQLLVPAESELGPYWTVRTAEGADPADCGEAGRGTSGAE